MNKRIESTLPNMVMSLVFICMGMSAALGYVYLLTKGPIENAAKNKEIAAITEVLSDAQGQPMFNNDPTTLSKEIDGLVFYEARMNDKTIGYAIRTFTNKGFSGRFVLMAGLLPDGTINKISVLEQKETPGLGDKMKTAWKNQFNGRNPETFKLAVKKDGGNVDAITASTITSRAFCDAVEKAYVALKKQMTQQTDSSAVNAQPGN